MPKPIKWDFSKLSKGIQERIGVEDENSLYRFHIRISAGYALGRGWTDRQEQTYREELKNAISKVFGEDKENRIKTDTDYVELSQTSCGFYAHPMEWDGYADNKNLAKVEKVLRSMNCVTDIKPVEKELLSPLSITDYENLIADNYPNIRKWFMVFDIENGYDRRPKDSASYEAGIEFAKQNRLHIRNPFDKVTGVLDRNYSSMDADARLVSCLYRAYQSQKAYEKQQQSEKNVEDKTNEDYERD